MKTIHFIYNGPEVNLGRFGHITKGTSLPMNPHEASDVMRDKRFTKSDKPFTHLEPKPSVTPSTETEVMAKTRMRADAEHEALIDNLNRCFDDNEKAKD
jgi:hypothetical protein